MKPSDIETLIRRSQLPEARAALRTIQAVPRADLETFARLCWRAGDPALGLQRLHPVVREEGRLVARPTDGEKAEYALCLLRVGAIAEAQRTLKPLKTPRAAFYRAAVHIACWRYAESLPLLKEYLESPLDEYERTVGNLNVAAALVFLGDFARADFLLRQALYISSLRGWPFVLSRAIALTGEKFIAERKYADAEVYLDRAAERLRQSGVTEEFLLRRFRAIVGCLREPDDEALSRLRAVREEAIARRHWETVRDCDRFEAVARRDEALLHRLYFGTPFEAFREVLIFDRRWHCEIPATYVFSPGISDPTAARIDLATGSLSTGQSSLKVGQANHRLLATLTSDFYRPFSAAALHECLFPGEFYNPTSSALRIRQAVNRLRKWCEDAGVSVEIVHKDKAYALGANCRSSFLITRTATEIERPSLLLETLRQGCAGGTFSVRQASGVLQISKSSTLRLLREGLEKGTLAREGAGQATVYRFVTSFKKAG